VDARAVRAVNHSVAAHGYRWQPEAGLFAIDGDRVVGVLASIGSGDPVEQRVALAERVLIAAESGRMVRTRPAAMLETMARAFAEEHLGEAPDEPVQVSVSEVLDWIDGPGLDVILGFVRTRRER
jgi:hypothetical protein